MQGQDKNITVHADIPSPGAHFTNDLSIVIQIQWKIGFGITPLWGIILLQNFAHAMTAKLSWHVQNSIAITSQQHGWQQGEISIPFKLEWKTVVEMGLWTSSRHNADCRLSHHFAKFLQQIIISSRFFLIRYHHLNSLGKFPSYAEYCITLIWLIYQEINESPLLSNVSSVLV